MIKILIIEDNIEKLRKVISFLNNECSVPEADIHYVDCVRQGRGKLISNHYDLLLLDLVLPNNEEDDASADTGSRFLEEIHYNPNINIPIHIIGLTEFDKVFKDHYQEFEDKLWGLINFNLQNTDWTDKLKTKIFYLQNFKKKYREFIESENRFDIAIVTAINTEFEQIKSIYKMKKYDVPNDSLIYYSSTLNTKNNNNFRVIACCINQMGMQASAAVASKIISSYSPKKIIITGICAGIKDAGINLGDIVVANQLWDYESGKVIEEADGKLTFRPDMKCLPTDHGIISSLVDFSNSKNYLSNIYNDYKGVKPETQLNVKFGSIGSGPYVLASKQYLKELIEKDRKLIGIDMEGYGIYKASQFYTGTIPIFVKAVSDFGDEKKNDNFQDYASYVSARFTFDYLYNTF